MLSPDSARREWSTVEWGEQVDGIAVGIEHPRVALAPERVPRVALRREACRHDRGVGCVDSRGRAAVEREPERVVRINARLEKETVHRKIVACVEERLLAE